MRLSILLDDQNYRDIRKKQYLLSIDQKISFKQLFRRHQKPNFRSPQSYRLIASGIPAQYRSAIWRTLIPNIYNITDSFYNRLLLHLAQQRAQYLEYQQQQLALTNFPTRTSINDEEELTEEEDLRAGLEPQADKKIFKALKNIETDLPRTLPQLKQFHNNSQWHQKLTRILGAFALIRQDISYIQGLSQITALLQLQMNHELDTFISLTTLLSATPLNDFYTFRQHIIEAVCTNVLLVINRLAPELNQLLQDYQIEPQIYVVNWIMTMFTRIFQFDSIYMVWDILLANNISRKILEELCGAIVCGRKKAILECKNPTRIVKLLLHSKLEIDQEDWVLEHMRSIPRTF